jgi:T-complex protein 1 subunit zeta
MVLYVYVSSSTGYDPQETIVTLLAESEESGKAVGIDCSTGEAINPADIGIFDNYIVKKQMIHSCTVIASNLLLVDEIMRAGMSSLKG